MKDSIDPFCLSMFIALFSFLTFMIGASFFTSYIAVRLGLSALPNWSIGMIGAAYTFGIMLGAFLSAPLIARVGHIRAYAAFASIAASITLLHGLCFYPLSWFFLRIIWGVCVGSLYIVIESWLLNCSDDHNKGRIISLYGMALYGGVALGQYVFQGVPDYFALTPYMLATLFIVLSLIPIATTRSSYPRFELHSQTNIKEICAKAPTGIVNCVGAGIVNSIISTLFPLVMYRGGFSKAEFMHLLAFPVIAGALLQYPFGKLSDVIDRRKVLLILHVVSLCVVPFCVVFFNHWSLMVFLFMLGGVALSVYPISITHTCDVFRHQDQYAACIQTLLLIYGVGSIIGPVVGSLFMSIFGDFGIFIPIAFVSVTSGTWTFVRLCEIIPRRAEKISYVSTHTTSPLMGELDPRRERKPDLER